MIKDVVIHASQSIKFDVKMIGEPPPKKIWMFGNISSKMEEKINIENEPYRTKLSIINCDKRDTGTYLIKVENSVGSDEATMELTVLGKNCYSFLLNMKYNLDNRRFKFFERKF
ncbi:twitchin [Caerostris extrusa]|uniref:Twitchin n=1 Tax=Caerostris extrusa TaxID=172846 RepID=A0AAV4UHP6_CAEEX|nr:twitchin [Caerostris extrusa]